MNKSILGRTAAMLFLGCVSIQSAIAQVSFELEQNVAATPDGSTVAVMNVNWANDLTIGTGGISTLQLELTLPSGVSVSGCTPTLIPGTNHTINPCDLNTGPGTFTIALSDVAVPPLNEAIPDGSPLFQIEFTVAPGTLPGILPIGFTDFSNQMLNTMGDTIAIEFQIQPGVNFNGTAGSLLVAVPAGESFYTSTPAIGTDVNFGSAVVGQTTMAQTISVSNLQNDGMSAFDITGASGTNGGATIVGTVPGGTATVPADGGTTEVDVTFDCTPTARGNQTGTLAIANDSDNAGPSAGHTYTCAGLAPMVQVGPLTQDLEVATVAGSMDSDTFTVTNDNSDGFSSSTDVTISLSALTGPAGTPPTVMVSPLIFTLNPGDDQVVTSQCSSDASTTPGAYTLTATVGFTTPLMVISPAVTVECVVSAIAPGYTSAPTAGSTLAFDQVENGQTSAAQTINIGNADSIGSGAQAQLEITGAMLSDSTNYSFSPDPFTATLAASAPNGTASIDVSCNPQSIGDFSGATLTVNTNDGDQVYNLSCEGTSNAGIVATPNVIDGTLNLGSVPPNTTASSGITFSNTGTDPLNLTCTLTNDNAGVITSTALPNGTAIPPDFTITFDGTPPGITSSQETLDCEVDDPATLAAPDQTFTVDVVVSGRPLIVPTLSQWGLLALMLSLLLAGGLYARRTMA